MEQYLLNYIKSNTDKNDKPKKKKKNYLIYYI